MLLAKRIYDKERLEYNVHALCVDCHTESLVLDIYSNLWYCHCWAGLPRDMKNPVKNPQGTVVPLNQQQPRCVCLGAQSVLLADLIETQRCARLEGIGPNQPLSGSNSSSKMQCSSG